MMNLCVRGMVVNGDNPKSLVGYGSVWIEFIVAETKNWKLKIEN